MTDLAEALQMRIELAGQSYADWQMEVMALMRVASEGAATATIDTRHLRRAGELIDLLEAEIGVLEGIAAEVGESGTAGQIDGVRTRMSALLMDLMEVAQGLRSLLN